MKVAVNRYYARAKYKDGNVYHWQSPIFKSASKAYEWIKHDPNKYFQVVQMTINGEWDTGGWDKIWWEGTT